MIICYLVTLMLDIASVLLLMTIESMCKLIPSAWNFLFPAKLKVFTSTQGVDI